MNESCYFDEDGSVLFCNGQGELIALADGLLLIDEAAGFGGDLSQYPGVAVYAERVSLKNTIKAKTLLISAYQFQAQQGRIDVSGKAGEAPPPNTAEEVIDGTDGEASGNVYVHSDQFDKDKVELQILAVGGQGGDSRLQSSGTAGSGGAGGQVYWQVGRQSYPELDETEEALYKQNAEITYWLHEKTRTQGGIGGRAVPKRGTDGIHGSVTTEIFQDWGSVGTRKLWIHPDQCHMYLQKAKRYYWVGDLHQDEETYGLVYQMLKHLEKQLDYALREEVLPVYLAQADKLGTIIGTQEDNVFVTLRAETLALLNKLQQGHDFYDHEYNWVPNLSFTFYLDLAEQAQTHFGETEQAFQAYRDSLQNERVDMEQIERSKVQLDLTIQHAEQAKMELEKELHRLENLIAVHEGRVNARKADVEEAKADLADQIKEACGYTVTDMIAAFSMCGFAPNSKLLVGSQAVDFFYKSNKMIVNAEGIPAQKKYVLKRVQRCCAGIEGLMEGYHSLQDGSKEADDPSANKLLVQEKELLSILDQFYDVLDPYQADRDKIKSYVQAILLRNDLLLAYNQTLGSWMSSQIESLSAQQQKRLVQKDALEHVRAGLPLLVNFMTDVYSQAQQRLLEMLYLAQRAYHYWGLTSKNVIGAILGSKPPGKMTSELFATVISALRSEYAVTMEGWRCGSNAFPDKEEEAGFLLPIIGDQLMDALVDLSTNGSFTYTLFAQDDRQQEALDPFERYYNVRVDHVRLHLKGAPIEDRRIAVKIIHGTKESIRNERGVYKTFIQSPVTLLYEHDYSSGQTFTDGKFESEGKAYAGRSPLCQWTFFIEDTEKKDIKFPYFDIEEMTLEFHGTFQVRD